MVISGNPAGTRPAADGSASKAYLIPTPAGAWYAVSGNREPARGTLLTTLLRGGARFPMSLDAIMQWTALTERKKIAGLLFALQREGLLSGDATPLVLPQDPFATVLARDLATIANGSTIVLAESAGFCVAYAGTSQDQAELLAARVASLDPRLRRFAVDDEGWRMGDENSESRLGVRPINFSPYRFLLVSNSTADLQSEAIVNLISALACYCLGTVSLNSSNNSSPP